MGTDSYGKGTNAFSKGEDKFSKGEDSFSKGTSKHGLNTAKGRLKVTHDHMLRCINGNEFKPADSIMKKFLVMKNGGTVKGWNYHIRCKGNCIGKTKRKTGAIGFCDMKQPWSQFQLVK